MAIRGFIIAIEAYNNYLPDLPGINDEAELFRKWLLDIKGVDPANVYACVDQAKLGWATTGTSSNEIIAEIRKLTVEAPNLTEELYFYYAGHGYSQVSDDANANVMVASDFDEISQGRACISLDEIKEKLWRMLGPGEHYYFVDACRNDLKVKYSTTGIPVTLSNLGTPNTYRLYSTAPGETARTSTAFSRHLLDGLKGTGRAKDYTGGQLWVLFDTLYEFLKSQIKSQSVNQYVEGAGDGKIFQISPVPQVTCNIEVKDAAASDSFNLVILTDDGNELRNLNFQGPATVLTGLRPNNYVITVSDGSGPLRPESESGPLTYLENVSTLVFLKPGPLPPPSPAAWELPDAGTVGAMDDPGSAAEFSEAEAMAEHDSFEDFDEIHTTRSGINEIEATAGPEVISSDYNTGFIQVFSSSAIYDQVFKSEGNLKITAAEQIALWLSLMGAAKIAMSPVTYDELFQVPLALHDNIPVNGSQLTVLAVLRDAAGQLEFKIDHDLWQVTQPISPIDGMRSISLPIPGGAHLLSLRVNNGNSWTYPIFSLPRRANLISVVEDMAGSFLINQFLLPIFHLIPTMDPTVQKYIDREPVQITRAIAMAQLKFGRKIPLESSDFDGTEWDDLIHSKWLDPIMSLMAAYDLIRRGGDAAKAAHLEIMIANLRQYFPGLPDTEAIARILGFSSSFPGSPPLFLDGILTYDIDFEERIGPPPEKLDYGSYWTRWFDVFD